LANRALRQALAQGLLRVTVAAAALPGLGWEAETWGDPAAQPDQAGYTDWAAAAGVAYDPDGAATVLDTLGWVLDADEPDGLRRRAGETLHLRYLVDPGDLLSEAEALQVAAQWGDLGVDVTLVRPADATAYADALAAGGFDVTSAAWTNRLAPERDLAPWFASGGRRNVTAYSDARVDTWLADAAVTLDATRRATLIGQAAERVIADVAVIPLYVLPDTWAVRPALANFGPCGLATLRWEDVGWKK
jgi:peptide/nickel transport system substrate-binding protein